MAALPTKLPPGIQAERVHRLNSLPPSGAGKHVLYWMQRSVRTEYNHALEYAIHTANAMGLPVCVLFVLTQGYPSANERHYAFLLQGLADALSALRRRGVRLAVRLARDGSVPAAVLRHAADAAVLVTDRGYTRVLRGWREEVAGGAKCAVVQVESDVVVPVATAKMRSASQLRSRMSAAVRAHFMAPPPTLSPLVASLDVRLAAEDEDGALDVTCPEAVLAGLDVDRSVPQLNVPAAGAGVVLRGGQMEAKRLLAVFLQKGLNGFAKSRNEPFKRAQSHLSPYLHYGHISVVNIAAKVLAHKSSTPRDRTKYVDELVVFRELAINYCFNNPSYDSVDGLPKWAQDTLEAHRSDTRHTIYTPLQLERGETSDPLWNAAQHEMVVTGKMHNYLRMYWAKQLLRWMADPREAYQLAVMLNDKYSLDGRDCNGYMGIAWCFGATDRPFPESAIFGKVRQMSSRGVSARKNTARYIDQVRDACRAIACARTKALVPPAAAYVAGALYPLISAQRAPANPPAVGKTAPPATGTGIVVKGTGAFDGSPVQSAGVAISHVSTGARGKAAARSAAKAPAKSAPQPPSKTRDLRSYFAAAAPSAAATIEHKAARETVSEAVASESESLDAPDSRAQSKDPAAAAAAAAHGKAHTAPFPGANHVDVISDVASDGSLEHGASDVDDGAIDLSDADDDAQGGACGGSSGRPPKRHKT